MALAWTGLVLAQAATEGGDVTVGEPYLRLVLECRAKLAAAAAPSLGLPSPPDDLIVSVMIVVAVAFLANQDAERAESWAEEATRLGAGSWRACPAIPRVR
jgi:hypothetical protein